MGRMSVQMVARWQDSQQFRAQVLQWADRLKVKPKSVRLQPMTTKWASCSDRGLVSFNSRLLSEDPAFGEYVIVHELLHLKVPNHGPLFKSLLRAYLPGINVADYGPLVCGR
jgi:predicted metal-dependent hydrolase